MWMWVLILLIIVGVLKILNIYYIKKVKSNYEKDFKRVSEQLGISEKVNYSDYLKIVDYDLNYWKSNSDFQYEGPIECNLIKI